MKKILYIGNKLSRKNSTLTTVEILSKFLKNEGFQIRTASDKNNRVLRLLDMVYTVFRYKNKTDVVLIDTYSTQNFYYALIVAGYCKFLSLPYIPILHGANLPERLKKDKRKSDFLFKNARINVSPSLYLLNSFNDFGFKNTVYIPNSIEIKNYHFLKRRMEPKLLWVRSFSEIYNPMLALRVVELLLSKFPKVTLCMVGPEKDGSMEQCMAYAKKNKLPVTFRGKLDKEAWLMLSENYSIFINTTNFDNAPVSVIEAMALGLPVVSTNVGGIPYLLKNEEEGLLVPPNSEMEFTKAIVKLLNDNELAVHLSSNARKKAETFDWEKVKQQWFKILD